MPAFMHFPYIDPTNYTEFINNNVTDTINTWILDNLELIIVYAILLYVMRLAWVTNGQNNLPLLIYVSLLIMYYFVYKSL